MSRAVTFDAEHLNRADRSEQVVARADAALYSAKEAGRDRVVVA